MPSSAVRRPLGRGFAVPAPAVRPLAAPFAAVFGVLVAAEDGYLGWLLVHTGPGWGWYLVLPLVSMAGALTGAVLVVRGAPLGRLASGSAVLALSCLLPLLGLLGLAAVLAYLGAGQEVAAVLLLAGPVGGLALALQQPVRGWTRRRRVPVSRGGRARRPG